MATVAEILKDAFEKEDWNKISDLHKALTGKPLERKPKLELATPEDLAKMDINIDLGAEKTYTPPVIQAPQPQTMRQAASGFIAPAQNNPVKKNGVGSRIIDNPRAGFRDLESRKSSVGEQQARKEPMAIPHKRVLEWTDDGTEEVGERISSNPMLAKLYEPSLQRPRITRESPELVEIKCKGCGTVDEVVVSLVTTDEYRCNDCASQGGKRNK